MKAIVNLIGKKVKINIQNPETYTDDLYKSIQSEIGTIIEKNDNKGCYNDAYLVEFGAKACHKYAKTHSGKWSGQKGRKTMSWWTESKDFTILN